MKSKELMKIQDEVCRVFDKHKNRLTIMDVTTICDNISEGLRETNSHINNKIKLKDG